MKFKIKSLKEYIEMVMKNLSESDKVAFIVAALGTLFTHFVFFANNWANEDSLFASTIESQMLGSGRWMPGNLLCEFISPGVLLLIVTLVLSIIAILIVKMFDIKSRLYAGVIALLLVTFPVLSMSFGYGFMIERYMMGMLLSVLAVYVTQKSKYGFLVGGLLLTISLSYYQSYVTISITLVAILILLKLLENGSTKETRKYVLKFAAMGVIGVVIYLLVVKVGYKIAGVELLEYKGMNNIGSIPPIAEWAYLLKRTYGHVLFFLFGERFFSPSEPAVVAQLILVLVSALLIFKAIREERRNVLNVLAIIGLVLLFPLGMNILDFLMYKTHISTLNIYQFVFIFILPFVLLNYAKKNENKMQSDFNVLEIVSFIAAIVVVWSNFTLNNVYYTKMEKYNKETILLTNRIFARIESYPGVTDQTKVLLGNRSGVYGVTNDSAYDERIMFDQGLWSPFIGYSFSTDYDDYKFHVICKNLIGVSYVPVSKEERLNIMESDEYDKMPTWPNEESINYIDNILVVKMS